jgi:hypothetical protein
LIIDVQGMRATGSELRELRERIKASVRFWPMRTPEREALKEAGRAVQRAVRNLERAEEERLGFEQRGYALSAYRGW